jgi:hypothetical protein
MKSRSVSTSAAALCSFAHRRTPPADFNVPSNNSYVWVDDLPVKVWFATSRGIVFLQQFFRDTLSIVIVAVQVRDTEAPLIVSQRLTGLAVDQRDLVADHLKRATGGNTLWVSNAMSALHPKADMCSATMDVCFGQ